LKFNISSKIEKFINTKQFHMCMVGFIIFIILFVVGVICLKYSVEGEGKPPFILSKISVISTVEGIDIEDATNKWNLQVSQNNDIYLYIKKNKNYSQTEAIESVKIDNFNIEKSSNVGKIKLFKPDSQVDTIMFKNSTENECRNIEYIGSMESNIKEQKISNQGGLVVFRYAITEVGNYISNEDEQINHSELLNKLSINNNDLKFKVTCDICINLVSGKAYKASMNLELPINDIVNGGTQSIEYADLENIVFKRL